MRAQHTEALQGGPGPAWLAAGLAAVLSACAGPYVPPPWPGPSNPERVRLHARRAASAPEPGQSPASRPSSAAPAQRAARGASAPRASYARPGRGGAGLYLQAYDVRLGTTPIRSSVAPPMQLGIPGSEPEREELPDPTPLVMSEEQLVDLILELVEPDSWDEEGVSLRAVNGVLFVRNSAQAQRGVSTLLRSLGL